MENLSAIVILALLSAALVRCLLLPIRWFWKIGINSFGGFLCLWLLDSVSAFTGVYIPLNAVTVAVAGFLGLPGIGILTILALL